MNIVLKSLIKINLIKSFTYRTSIFLESFEPKEEDLQAFYKLVGQNVKNIRNEKGISQLQLANLIGHDSVAHIAKAELNKYGKRFNLEHLYKISLALNVDIKRFFDGTESLQNPL